MMHLEDLQAAYAAKFPTSRVWAQASSQLLPGGVAHDGRATAPFPLFIASAAGPRKHDLDGNELIDYWMGHGALMLGHSPPAIVDAVAAQCRLGTHYGAGHLAEVRWAQRIVELVPSAERVRFVASGTEATLLALRLSRAATRGALGSAGSKGTSMAGMTGRCWATGTPSIARVPRRPAVGRSANHPCSRTTTSPLPHGRCRVRMLRQ